MLGPEGILAGRVVLFSSLGFPRSWVEWTLDPCVSWWIEDPDVDQS